ncbi:MAG: hypothetical protein CMJ33_07810 [Phycisphaerae bacterium]|nr:hypothetical protein [Phycisphaerae bacterium]HAW95110.1 hypothetical protein [Phycisphaerales bacterium]
MCSLPVCDSATPVTCVRSLLEAASHPEGRFWLEDRALVTSWSGDGVFRVFAKGTSLGRREADPTASEST